MSKKSYFRIHHIKNDSDVKVTWQYAPCQIVSDQGTHEADDRLCITMASMDGTSLAAFFTIEQIDKFLIQLNQVKNELQRRYDEKRGIKPPF